jgi:hypothetical protein
MDSSISTEPRPALKTRRDVEFEIGHLGAQIEDLRDEVIDLNEEIASLETQRSDLEDRLLDCGDDEDEEDND